MEPDLKPHPAKFPDHIVERIGELLPADLYPLVLDPFAGVGKIHALPNRTVGVELEPEWANAHRLTLVGDATKLGARWTNHFDAVATSPAYGNRMADSYDGRDGSKRLTYRLKLDRELHARNGASMQWGNAYKVLHRLALREMVRVVRPAGLIIVNMKNHRRGGTDIQSCDWWASEMVYEGLSVVERIQIETKGFSFGANLSGPSVEELIVAEVPA